MADGEIHDPDCCAACGYARAVAIGEVVPPVPGAPIACRVDAAGAPQGMVLVLVRRGAETVRVPVDRGTLVVGRSKPADVVVPMQALSRRQCRFEFGTGGVFVEDLDSACGTYVDGRAVRRARLHHGQRVQMADLAIELEIA